ncbi:MAG: sensor histidine kinase [Polyangiales bacterium]
MTVRRAGFGLSLSMAAAIAIVSALAWWDGEREAQSAFEDFAHEQSILAAGVAAGIGARIDREGIAPLQTIERPHELRVLLLRAGATSWVDAAGRSLDVPTLSEAAKEGRDVAVFDRPAASALDLPFRRAVAGLARVNGHTLAIVTTAQKERDRESRARIRLLSSVGLASAIVFAFGAIARRNQRKELELERELAIADLSRRRDDQLGRANRIAMMGTLATGVAHEISTPLGVIAGRAEQLLARTEDERGKKGLHAILEQTDRIAKVVRGFLDLSRGGEPALARHDPGEVARSAIALIEHRFEQAGVELASNIAPSLPEVQCDARLMEHALVNLLLNGCQASPRGETVTFSVFARGDRVVFDVIDRGAGISPEEASQALEPFFTTKPEGSGLGLAITSEIVKAHRGTLALAPEPQRGTRATIEIPVS